MSKICKKCKSEIDNGAKICPNCRKKQGMPIWLIVILVIVGISMISSLSSEESNSNNEKAGTTKVDSISLLDGHTGVASNEYSYDINGILQNNTNNEYSYVSVEFYVYDSQGNLLDTCDDYSNGLEPNAKWNFTASCFFENDDSNKVSSYKLKEISKW